MQTEAKIRKHPTKWRMLPAHIRLIAKKLGYSETMVRSVAQGKRKNSEIQQHIDIVSRMTSEYWATIEQMLTVYANTRQRIAEAITGEGAMAATDTDTVIASTEE
jgi:hypothetical protein